MHTTPRSHNTEDIIHTSHTQHMTQDKQNTHTHDTIHHHIGSVFCLRSVVDQPICTSLVAMTPLEVVTSFEKHMAVEVKLGLCTIVEAAAKSLPILLTHLRSLKPSMGDVTALLAYLTGSDNCLFSGDQKREIGQVVNAKMVDQATVSTRVTSACKTQQHLGLHNYLPARLWARLESEDQKGNKFRQLAQFMCQSLGLRNPDAKTKRLAVVVVHLASNDDPDPQVAYADMQLFGDIMEQKRQSVCTKQSMASFPEDPKVFMHAHPDAYGPEDPPVACRVSLEAIVARCKKSVTPCRNTNLYVRGGHRCTQKSTPLQSTPASPTVPADSVHALFSAMEKFMFQKGHAPLGIELAPLRASLGALPPVGERHSPVGPQLALEGPSTALVDASSNASGSSPAPMFSGAIMPGCLDPCHDKLAQLKAKLGCAEDGGAAIEDAPLADGERGAGEEDGAAALPRLSTKRPPAAAADDEPAALGAEDAKPAVMRRPAAAAKTAAKVDPPHKKARRSGAPKAAASVGGAKPSIHEALLGKPAKVARPPQTQEPTAHAGGRIYFSKPKGCYRVYLRIGDRIEKSVKADAGSVADMRRKFQICCALIENDKRPAA